jgi:hypothetical protein
MNPLLTALLRDGYPLATIAKAAGIKERLLRSCELTERDQALLERYASNQPCCRSLIDSLNS